MEKTIDLNSALIPNQNLPSSVRHLEHCILCGRHELEVVFSLVPTPIADSYIIADQIDEVQSIYPLDIALCCACGHVQLSDVVNAELLYGEYLYKTTTSPGLKAHFDAYAGQIIRQAGLKEGALAVDIGSNDGTLLKAFQERGMRVLGIDPARQIAQKASDAGIETLPAFFSLELAQEIRRGFGAAACITANNVIANIDDLDSLVQAVRELLSPDGVFVFETGYLLDLIKNLVFDNIYHEHLSYFAVNPLEKFFHRHGLEFVEIERVPTKGGSLRAIVQLVGGPRRPSASIEAIKNLELDFGLGLPLVFKRFAGTLQDAKDTLLRFLNPIREQGKLIAGYGASHSVTTLVFHFGLGGMIDFLVDDNPLKQGRFSPGCHLPVLSPDALCKQAPSYTLILPWRFADSIIKKHSSYLGKGGHFVLPLPALKVV